MSSEFFRVAPYISWNRVEGELALFDTRDGRYHLLNRSSAEIWRGLAERMPSHELAGRLAEKHGVAADEMANNIREFVAASLADGLLINDDIAK